METEESMLTKPLIPYDLSGFNNAFNSGLLRDYEIFANLRLKLYCTHVV